MSDGVFVQHSGVVFLRDLKPITSTGIILMQYLYLRSRKSPEFVCPELISPNPKQPKLKASVFVRGLNIEPFSKMVGN